MELLKIQLFDFDQFNLCLLLNNIRHFLLTESIGVFLKATNVCGININGVSGYVKPNVMMGFM